MNVIVDLEASNDLETNYKKGIFSAKQIVPLLFLRTILFLFFQLLFFLGFTMTNRQESWQQSANWWPFVVTFTNVVCVFVLHKLLKRENKSFFGFFPFIKGRIIKDFLIMSGLLLLSLPISYLPNIFLGNLLFGNYMEAIDLFYRPLPLWAAWTALFVFPITMPLGELTTYFGYIMPRLEVITKSKWLSFTLPALMLSFQHMAFPLLFDLKFIVWRLLMFLPFAFIIGLIIRWKPRLFPYILIGHFFIDIMTAVSILLVSTSNW